MSFGIWAQYKLWKSLMFDEMRLFKISGSLDCLFLLEQRKFDQFSNVVIAYNIVRKH